MSIFDVAEVAVKFWPVEEQARVMVAISGAEAGWRADAQGDPLSIFTPEEADAKRPYACRGFTSFGPWQIHLPAHWLRVRIESALREVCENADWLMDYGHSGLIARQVFDSQGYGAWTAYNNGSYRDFLFIAAQAVALEPGAIIVGGALEPVEPPETPVEPPSEGIEPPVVGVPLR